MTKEKLKEISVTERCTIDVLWKQMCDRGDDWSEIRKTVLVSIEAMDKAVEVYNMENGKKE